MKESDQWRWAFLFFGSSGWGEIRCMLCKGSQKRNEGARTLEFRTDGGSREEGKETREFKKKREEEK
jgi:hypothetical protein